MKKHVELEVTQRGHILREDVLFTICLYLILAMETAKDVASWNSKFATQLDVTYHVSHV